MAETKQRLAALPPDTIVFYDDIWKDAAGQIFVPGDALEELSSVSRAPIFSHTESYLGYGMVGGSCIISRTLAPELAGQIAAVLRAGSANSVPVMRSAEQPAGIRCAAVAKIRRERKPDSAGQPGAIPHAHLVGSVSPNCDRYRGGPGRANRFDCGTAVATPPQAASRSGTVQFPADAPDRAGHDSPARFLEGSQFGFPRLQQTAGRRLRFFRCQRN